MGLATVSLETTTTEGLLAAIKTLQSLNNDSLKLTLYEDTDGDGNAENSKTYTLSGSSNEIRLPDFDLSVGNEFWYRVEASDDSDITTALDNLEVTVEG